MFRILFIFLLPFFVFGAELSPAEKNASIYGALTLIPPLVAIALAFITKDVILSLFLGVLSGTFLIGMNDNGVLSGFVAAFTDLCARVVASMADAWNAGILLQVMCIGGLIALVTKSGGTKAIAMWLGERAKTGVRAQIYTWFMGIIIFFDDYANALILGPIMRPLMDRFKISRAKFAFIIDATAAPITGIALISTWVGVEISAIKEAYAQIGVEDINAFTIFVETIPYRFYNIYMLFFVVASAVMMREFGPMYRAEMASRAGKNGGRDFKIANLEDQAFSPKEGIEPRKINALIPLGAMIVLSVIGFYANGLGALGEEELKAVQADPFSFVSIRTAFSGADASVVLFQAAMFSSIIGIVLGLWQKIYGIKEGIEIWIGGWKTMLTTVLILLFAWSLSSTIKELGTSKYLVDLLGESTPMALLALVIFVLSSIISFSTGTSFGTMGIVTPLAVPLAASVGAKYGLSGDEFHAFMCLNISSVFTGAIFGDHCSPISDTTILSSMGAGCDHIEHVSTQLPYAIVVGIISTLCGFLPASLGVNVWVCLLFGLGVTVLAIRILGKKVSGEVR
ncbi:Na+/H+ antiporter NhaC family protein [Campylobacter sp. JMF_01 NE2]|uniref:Na+/H+ antiporter NhaC family protein n=1 Tax=unclassified Campylobacter TaxID=2593542 RepID=UPI0022E9997E|nr:MULTISPECIES: Na+/H+ antiporter NhaC family protein [unclassified Campylobacter]MDA3051872.1 Na+/H+ antiporter NhaC family protein [Campylobacter sp. JMF_03 NE3]MDA3066206.1 Na+/H+ antiporter NhaC family protein [Campylobacter sp. JMF_01 NE2]